MKFLIPIVLFSFCLPVAAQEETGNRETDVNFVPGKGLDVTSSDEQFRLTTKVFGQVLYTATEDQDTNDWTQSFEIRRARLIFSGHFYGEHNKYYIQFAFSPKDMQFKDGVPTKSPVFDWYFRFDHLRDLTLQVGQYRVPYTKQRRIPIAKLQFIDRAIGNFEYNLDRDIGFDLRSKDLFGIDLLRYHAGVFIGEGRDGYASSDFGMLYVARLELFPLGLFNDMVEADLKRRDHPGLSFGAAYAYLAGGKGNRGILGAVPSDGGTSDTHNLTADIMFKVEGISIFSEFYYREVSRNFGDVQAVDDAGNPVFDAYGNPVIDEEDPRNGLGWFAQLGWLLPKIPVELVTRYGQVHPTEDNSSIGRQDEIGAGINWYINGPSMVLSADYHHRFLEDQILRGADEIRVRFQAGF